MTFQPCPAYFQGLLKEKKIKQCVLGGWWGGEGKVLGVHMMWKGSLLPFLEIGSSGEGSDIKVSVFMLHKYHSLIMAIISFTGSKIDMTLLHPLHFLKVYLRM